MIIIIIIIKIKIKIKIIIIIKNQHIVFTLAAHDEIGTCTTRCCMHALQHKSWHGSVVLLETMPRLSLLLPLLLLLLLLLLLQLLLQLLSSCAVYAELVESQRHCYLQR